MRKLYKIIVLVALLWAASNLSGQNVCKFDFDLDYIAEMSNNPYAGSVVVIDDSTALVNFGGAVLCKANFKTGEFLDTLDNVLLYEKLQSKIKSTEIYNSAEFFTEKDIEETTGCSGYYLQFWRLFRNDSNTYLCEVKVSTKNFGVLSTFLEINQDLEIERIRVRELAIKYGVSTLSLAGYYPMGNELFIQSRVRDTSVYTTNTPGYFSRFEYTGDHYKFKGLLDGVDHGKRKLYTSRFHSFFYNDERLCTTNGWSVFCFNDSLKKCEFNIDLGLSEDQVYSTIRHIGGNEYIAVKMNLADDIGAAVDECYIVLLDDNFKEFDTLLEFDIQKTSLNSFDYFNGNAYLYWHHLKKDELILKSFRVDEYRQKGR
jgi:hypothetical protein